ncbi:MAG: ATP-binding protein [Candidatus Gastranaerophilaceae bacterium]
METENSKNHIPMIGVFSTAISVAVIFSAFFAVKIFTDFSEKKFTTYAKTTADTLSYQFSSVMSEQDFSNISILKNLAKSALHNDKNIMLIEYSDINNNIVFEETSSLYDAKTFDGIKINTILNTAIGNELENSGTLKVFVTNVYNNKDIDSQKFKIIGFFIGLWLFIMFVITFYNGIINRELNLLCVGLKRISDGYFGTKISDDGRKQTKELVALFNNLSLKLKKYEEENVENILLERNKLEAILMSIVNGVIVCNNEDEIVLVNSAAEKMLSISAENIMGIRIQSYTDSDAKFCFRDKIEEFKDTPLDIILKNPPEFTVTADKKIIKCVISPMFMQNDDYVGYIIVMIDVTKETEVNNLKNQFISNVSHELRTPVTVLRTYLDTLDTMSEELDEETKKEFISTANKEVTRLHRMVNDILDVSRLESPDVELEKENADIVPVIADTISSMQVLADEKHVKINFAKSENEVVLPFNVVNMERVFNNLISNAIKYSPENGKIDVILKKEKDFVDISVKDEGPGIEEKHLAKLFDRFYRVENSVHTVKGTGLGLYLVKTTVEKHHHGKVYVNSKVGEGSTFGIQLPLSENV